MPQNYQQSCSAKRQFANCQLDTVFQTLSTPDKIIRLRGKLYFVLWCLVDNQNQLVTRQQLIDECWKGNSYTGQKAVTHTICQLRKLLRELNIPASIATLSKQGYIFTQKDISSRHKIDITNSMDISEQLRQ